MIDDDDDDDWGLPPESEKRHRRHGSSGVPIVDRDEGDENEPVHVTVDRAVSRAMQETRNRTQRAGREEEYRVEKMNAGARRAARERHAERIHEENKNTSPLLGGDRDVSWGGCFAILIYIVIIGFFLTGLYLWLVG